MRSPNTLHRDNRAGTTLMEVLVVLAIFIILMGAGLAVGVDTYKRYLFRSTLNTTAAIIQKARSSAMSNIGQSAHGVYLANAGTLVLFRGASYAGRIPAYDLNIDMNEIAASGASEIVFAPLSGETSAGNITLTGVGQSADITINNEGGIEW